MTGHDDGLAKVLAQHQLQRSGEIYVCDCHGWDSRSWQCHHEHVGFAVRAWHNAQVVAACDQARQEAERYRLAWLAARRRAIHNDWRVVEAWEAADDALRERDQARQDGAAEAQRGGHFTGGFGENPRLRYVEDQPTVRTLPADWDSIRDGVLSPGLRKAADDLRAALAGEGQP